MEDTSATSSDFQFPWGGNSPFPIGPFIGTFFLSSAMTTAVIGLHDFDKGFVKENAFDPNNYRGVMLVTGLFIFLNYFMMGVQMSGKRSEIENMKLASERIYFNLWEQRSMFLFPFWLYAALVNYDIAAKLGLLYVITRFLYFFFYAYYGGFTVLVELATQPNYAVLAHFFTEFILQGFGFNYTEKIGDNKALLVLVFFQNWFLMVAVGLGKGPAGNWLAKTVEWRNTSGIEKMG